MHYSSEMLLMMQTLQVNSTVHNDQKEENMKEQSEYWGIVHK